MPKAKLEFGAKAEFVRKHPDVPAAELVTIGRKQGIKLTKGHIYNIRSTDRKNGITSASAKSASGRVAPTGSAISTETTPEASSTTTMISSGEYSARDAELRSLVLRMGFDRAEKVFSQMRESLTV